MGDYKKAVEYYAKNKQNNLLHNKGNEHALIIFENLFKYSENYIRIAAHDLSNEEVVNTRTYIDAIIPFLNKSNTHLDILLVCFNEKVKEIKEEHNFFKNILKTKAFKEGRVRIKNGDGIGFISEGQNIHFCTSDDHAYRFEFDINERKARCNFQDITATGQLISLFDLAFNSESVHDVNLKNIFA